MAKAIRNFWRKIEAQDLVEYTLLLAFVALVGITILVGASGSIQGIWGSSNSTLVAANTTAGGGDSSQGSGSGSGGGDGGGDHDGGGHDHHDH